MPYHEINLEKLSHNQILKLLRGERIRVKHGHGHKIHASHEQHKKIMAAHRKGCGVTMQFDPYQIDHHKSHGLFGNIGKAISTVVKSPFVHDIAKQAAPIALDLGKRYLENKLIGHGVGHHHHEHGEGHHVHHHEYGEGYKKHGEGKKVRRKTPKHRRKTPKHHGGALFGGGEGGALYAGGYGVARKGRSRGHGVGQDILKGIVKYGVPALKTAAMFI